MKKLAAIISLSLVSISATAITPLWVRDASISPDGKQIAFTYKGDIYKVSSTGGEAVRLTSLPTHEKAPVWSPDGKQLAFADNRNGNFDIFIMSAEGGTATRLTSNSAGEIPEAFSPDGKYVYFSASIQDPAKSALFPSSRMTELYKVPVKGGKIEQVIATPAEMISFVPGSNNFLYHDQKGVENAWRKHHTSSIARDVWYYDAKTGRHTNLTRHAGEDRNPVITSDGKTVYFLSERNGGSFNVYSFPIASPEKVKPETSFKNHPVRFLSISDNGTLAFTYDGELYTMANGGKPSRVNINLTCEDVDVPEVINVGVKNSEAAASPDGTQVAFINRGNVFVTSVEYPSIKQITNTPAAESFVAWHPKNRSLVYTSERDGHWNLYRADIDRKDDPNFSNATTITEVPLFNPKDEVERTCPQYSPDGEKLAFIADREKLMVMDVRSRKVKQLTDGSSCPDRSGNFSFSWSPDSRYIALEVVDRKHSPYSDIAIVNVEDGKITNITETGYFDMSPQWVLDGNAVMFKSDRLGMRNHASWGSLEDLFLVFMNRDAYDRFRLSEEDYALLKEIEKQQKKDKDKDKKDKEADSKKSKDKKSEDSEKEEKFEGQIDVELDGIKDRIVRLTPSSSDLSGAIITKDGETLYYLSAFEKRYDLWKKNLRKGDVSLVKKLDSKSMGMEMDASGKNIFLLGSSSLMKLDPKNDKTTNISVSGTQRINAAAEREAMFDNVVFQEREMFYTPSMHGVDWNTLTKHYRKFLPHINNGFDYADMLSEMLGELNVSHTGSGYRSSATNKTGSTASFGLLYDMNYTGDGLKVDEIVSGGPFDRASSKIAQGCIIEKINGEQIDDKTDYTTLFNDLAKKKTLVSIYNPANGQRWDEVVLPITASAMNELLYQRWVKNREADVDRLSGGRLGYVHIRSMSDPSFRTMYANILGKYNDREGIVIDTRFNGGGRMHEDIEILFSGDKYLTQEIRGKDICDMPSRRWNKPSIMLVCEANYSNAHGTPWVYKHERLGSVVGAPVPGTMTSVNWITMQNPDFYFGIPVIGYRQADGTYLENTQLEPDILVLNDPQVIVTGVDQQLKTAVDELIKQIDRK